MFNRLRFLVAYIFAIPLALILGVLSAAPGEITFMLIGMLLFFLALPLFFKWHHAMLIIFWNSAFSAFFLPGQPLFWLVFAAISFGLAVLNRIVVKKPFISAPGMTRPVLFFAAVVLFTAWYRGGIGIKSLGGVAHGGRSYIYILGAIIGYFAFTAAQIPVNKSGKITALFFLSGTSAILGNLAFTLGQSFYFMFYFVPTGVAAGQAATENGLTDIDRIQGLSQTCIALLCFLLAYYGLREIFRAGKPWRLLFLLATVGASFFSGFRSTSLILFFIFAFQFYLEGLFRTRLFPFLIAIGLVCLAALFLFATRLPLSVQRAISFLPVNVDAEVEADAMGSSAWRLEMWSVVWKEVPKYLLMGKGYGFDPAEMELTTQGMRMGILSNYEEAMLAGDYHSGPLSVLVPFGLPGAFGFLWVLIAGGRVLHLNYRHGDPQLQRTNTVLYSFYLAQSLSFFLIFGALNGQLFIFLGTVGLSVSLNGGVKREPDWVPARARAGASLPPAYAIELE